MEFALFPLQLKDHFLGLVLHGQVPVGAVAQLFWLGRRWHCLVLWGGVLGGAWQRLDRGEGVTKKACGRLLAAAVRLGETLEGVGVL